MRLCAPCVADVVNNPTHVRVRYKSGGHLGELNRWELMDCLETMAEDGETTFTEIVWGPDGHIIRLRAIIEIASVPMCVAHVAERSWQYPPLPPYRGR